MGKIKAFVAGAIVGAGVMAFTAAKTGVEMRQTVVDALNEVKEQATQANAEGGVAQVASEFVAKGKDIANDAIANGQDAVASASARVQDAAADITGSTDTEDLKRKIEEARARIVEQVMANAEESRAAVDGVVVTEADEAVVEAVEDVEEAPEEAAPVEEAPAGFTTPADSPAPGAPEA